MQVTLYLLLGGWGPVVGVGDRAVGPKGPDVGFHQLIPYEVIKVLLPSQQAQLEPAVVQDENSHHKHPHYHHPVAELHHVTVYTVSKCRKLLSGMLAVGRATETAGLYKACVLCHL